MKNYKQIIKIKNTSVVEEKIETINKSKSQKEDCKDCAGIYDPANSRDH